MYMRVKCNDGKGWWEGKRIALDGDDDEESRTKVGFSAQYLWARLTLLSLNSSLHKTFPFITIYIDEVRAARCRSLLLKWSLCNQQHHEIRIQGIANYYVIVYVTEAKNDADVGVSMCI